MLAVRRFALNLTSIGPLLHLETCFKPAMSVPHIAAQSTACGHLVVAWAYLPPVVESWLTFTSRHSPSPTHLRLHVTLRTVCLCTTRVNF